MRTALVAFIVGLVLAVVFTPMARLLGRSLKRGLLDLPEGGRRVHATPTPRTGGLAIAIAVLAPILGLGFYENAVSDILYRDDVRIATLLVGCLLALLLGLLDDLYRISSRIRLLAIVGIGLLEWFGGHRIDTLSLPFVGIVQLGGLGLPVTVLWIAGVMVAFNFIDGLDGLATGIALIGSITMLVIAYMDSNLLWLVWTAAMTGSLVGFLCFNFNPASIFMGDSGSNFIGCLMALVSLETSRKQSTALALFVPALILGLPILDAALTMFRRSLLREGMFQSERGHIHHRLLDLGLSQRKSVLVLYGFTLTLSFGALVMISDIPRLRLIAAVAIAVAIFTLMFVSGYIRLEDLRLMYRKGLDNKARLRALEAVARGSGASSSCAASPDLSLALSRLLEGTGISGISCQPTGGERVMVGDVVDDPKITQRSLPFEGRSRRGEVTVYWKGRDSEPSPGEIEALKAYLSRLDPVEHQ